jgi:hypothetical protein
MDSRLSALLRIMKRFALILLFLSSARFAAASHSDGTDTDTINQINAAVDGETVDLPSGDFHWTQKVTIPNTKCITLRGTGATRVFDDVSRGPLLSVHLKPNASAHYTRVTGIEFAAGTRANLQGEGQAGGGCIEFIGQDNRTDARLIWDRCKWTGLKGVVTAVDVVGVFSQLTVDRGGIRGAWLHPYHEHWNGGNFGDRSMSDPIDWGGENWLAIEHSTFGYTGAGLCDARQGARLLIRYNTFYNMTIQSHGTESGSFDGRRGLVAWEIYRNRFVATATPRSGPITNNRSGLAVIHDNMTTGWTVANLALHVYRCYWGFKPGGNGDAENPWDVNAAGNPFYTGSASVSNTPQNATNTVQATGTWGDADLTGHTIVKTSNRVAGQATYGIIQSNTPTSITYVSGFSSTNAPVGVAFATGDTFKIMKVDHFWDQPGRRGGSVLSRTSNKVSNPVLPSGGNDQITDPRYEWNNHSTEESSPGVPKSTSHFANSESKTIVSGIHFKNSTVKPGYVELSDPHPLVKRLSEGQ